MLHHLCIIGLQVLENIGVSLINTDEYIAWLGNSSYPKIQIT